MIPERESDEKGRATVCGDAVHVPHHRDEETVRIDTRLHPPFAAYAGTSQWLAALLR